MTGKQVLVVDDNPDILFAFSNFLKTEGYDCIPVSTSDEAIAGFSDKLPFSVFLDISSSELMGLFILRKMKEINPTIPVILMASIDMDQILPLAMQLGAFGCMEKPLSLTALREWLDKINKRYKN